MGKKKFKLFVINTAFRLPALYKRWHLLMQNNPDVDITLVGPAYSKSLQYGSEIEYIPEDIQEERFRVFHINMKHSRWLKYSGLSGWISFSLNKLIKKYQPDLIYLIGFEENMLSFQVGIARSLYVPDAKIAFFTMRGTDYSFLSKNPLNILFKYAIFKYTNKLFDAILCHYPYGRELIIRQRKYKKPVYIQTQIGVDKDIFRPDEARRKRIREKYGIKNEFVFGSVGRISWEKGVFDILDALPMKDKWRFLMIGGGRDFDSAQGKVIQMGLQEHVIMPGYVPAGEEIAAYMNAMDCFLHVPRTTKKWVDTFPGVVPEAMASALPVIGSDSGAVPYQLGSDGIIVPEGNIEKINFEITKIMNDPEAAKMIGQRMLARVMKTFEIRHLSNCFNIVMRENR